MLELLNGARAVALLGTCKNAGKTTAMNRLIRELAEAGGPVAALTSIGRDGESRDLVTGTDKPPIYLYEGMLAATAAGLLPVCDASREILRTTGIHTSLGEVVIFRARSDGFVQLAGPGIVEQLAPLRAMLTELGTGIVLIDGALSRRSPAAGVKDGACILSTGASLDRDLETVVAETAYAARLLTLPQTPAPGPEAGRLTLFRACRHPLSADGRAAQGSRPYGADHTPPNLVPVGAAALGGPESRPPLADGRAAQGSRPYGAEGETASLTGTGFPDFPALLDALRRERGPATVLLSGALTETQAKALLRSGAAREGLTLLCGGGSQLLLRRETFEALRFRGVRFAVRSTTRLAAVTVNPVSAGGWRFDPEAFRERMQAALPGIPVVDALRD
ncbi:MAG: hypothetical protein IJR65_06055 [Oscillospiraceae bacterium]|nr:hypothetical protein [Oscillospiraceae bacterium]